MSEEYKVEKLEKVLQELVEKVARSIYESTLLPTDLVKWDNDYEEAHEIARQQAQAAIDTIDPILRADERRRVMDMLVSEAVVNSATKEWQQFYDDGFCDEYLTKRSLRAAKQKIEEMG